MYEITTAFKSLGVILESEDDCKKLIKRLERELKNKPAGISTQTTVITASMIFSFISSQLSDGDPTRIAAQIVSGVGFLGAGVILKSESTNSIMNLTTAASIWYSASVGMALGFNFHSMALLATAFIIIVNRIPRFKSQN